MVLTGCGEGGDDADSAASAPPTDGGATTIVIEDFTFTPAVLRVSAGEPITVVNRDQVPHTATAFDAAFESGILTGGKTSMFSLDEPGEYLYRCDIHEGMVGQIVVTSSN